MHRLEDIKEAVMELVKDSSRKWNDTNNKGKMVVPNPAIRPGQVVVHRKHRYYRQGPQIRGGLRRL